MVGQINSRASGLRPRLLRPAGVEYMIESTAKVERSAIVYSKLRFVAFLLFALAVAAPSRAASDQSSTANPKSGHTQKKGRSPGGDVASGTGDIGKGAAKGAGNLAVGAGKGAVDLVTLHPIDAAASVGKGGVVAGKDVDGRHGQGDGEDRQGRRPGNQAHLLEASRKLAFRRKAVVPDPRKEKFTAEVNGEVYEQRHCSSLQVAGEALRILENTRHTNYQHNLVIDEATGTYDFDCSGFASYILGRVAPNHLSLIPIITPLGISESRLLAQDYYDFFSQLPNETIDGWRQILYLRDARRGDLIAWALPPPNPDTGHIFVVAADPVPVAENTLAAMAYDASDIHHYDDSRATVRLA